MNRSWIAICLIAFGALSACASGQKVPDWSISALGHVQRFNDAYLSGDARVARREFEQARADTARTGRPDLVARVELNRCAAQVASLDFAPCTGFDALAPDAGAAERAYARYLAGQAGAAEAPQLPPQHRAIAAGGASVAAIDEPLARLIAAAVLLRQGRATPDVARQAVDTASHQGWRRPLLAWLGVQRQRAEQGGDAAEVARIQRRMDLVQPAAPQAGPAR
ncbi:MAG: hypothetical protein R3E52_02370 [Burkholderiaceae bacterium]